MDFKDFRDDLGVRTDSVNVPINVNEALYGPLTILSGYVSGKSFNEACQDCRKRFTFLKKFPLFHRFTFCFANTRACKCTLSCCIFESKKE